MKQKPRNPVINEETAKQLLFRCMVCDKPTEGFYGSHASENKTPKGTCSGACERIQQAKPKYPGHSEEDFLARQGETLGDEDDFAPDA